MIKQHAVKTVIGLDKIKNGFYSIPSGLRKFLLRGVVLFIVWRILYKYYLKPSGVLDSKLIELVLWGTYKLLQPFYAHLSSTGYNIFINGKLAITIANPCNGLELMVLYLGFLFCLPTNWKKMTAFAFIGVCVTITLNIIRCAVLAAMFHSHYELADFMHHYLFKLMIYAVNFYLWVLYSKKKTLI